MLTFLSFPNDGKMKNGIMKVVFIRAVYIISSKQGKTNYHNIVPYCVITFNIYRLEQNETREKTTEMYLTKLIHVKLILKLKLIKENQKRKLITE